MGLRYRKSIKIAPGVRLNINKKSASVSVGGKGLRYTVNSNGRKTKTVGIPGTGLSYSETSSGKKSTTLRRTADSDIVRQTSPAPSAAEKQQKPPKIQADILYTDPADIGNVILGVFLLIAAFFISGFSWPLAIVVALLAAWCFLSYASYKAHPDDPKYITPEQLERWRGLLGIDKGNAYELGKKSAPILADLKEKVFQAVQEADGPTVLEYQKKIVDLSEFIVIHGDKPTEDYDRYATVYKPFEP